MGRSGYVVNHSIVFVRDVNYGIVKTLRLFRGFHECGEFWPFDNFKNFDGSENFNKFKNF